SLLHTSRWSSTVLKHELTHHLSAYFIPHKPRWLSEGLAGFLETGQLSDDGSAAVIGAGNHRFYETRIRPGRPVLSWGLGQETDTDQFSLYATSWVLVAWLGNHRAEQFENYQLRVLRGEDFAAAWKNAFADLSLPDLDEQLVRYVSHGTYLEVSVKVPPVEPAVAERTLPDADVHAIRARL